VGRVDCARPCGRIYCQPGGQPRGRGLVGNVLVGVLGAYAGGYLFSHFGAPGVTGFNLWSVLVASVGAMALLAVYNLSFGR
jgi:uncharacterized membrane protein YeaQ/YmgE (transglycosylase-associated protein family)